MKVIKRDGHTVTYDRSKIITAIKKANAEVEPSEKVTDEKIEEIVQGIESKNRPRMLVEDIQDIIEQKLMADCSTIEEALFADELGFDFIGTTMVGYTPQSKGLKIEENDFEILRTILKKVKHPVIAEGNVNSPEKAKRVIELGSYAVVVGSSITRPQLITKGYAEAVNSVEKETTV